MRLLSFIRGAADKPLCSLPAYLRPNSALDLIVVLVHPLGIQALEAFFILQHSDGGLRRFSMSLARCHSVTRSRALTFLSSQPFHFLLLLRALLLLDASPLRILPSVGASSVSRRRRRRSAVCAARRRPAHRLRAGAGILARRESCRPCRQGSHWWAEQRSSTLSLSQLLCRLECSIVGR